MCALIYSWLLHNNKKGTSQKKILRSPSMRKQCTLSRRHHLWFLYSWISIASKHNQSHNHRMRRTQQQHQSRPHSLNADPVVKDMPCFTQPKIYAIKNNAMLVEIELFIYSRLFYYRSGYPRLRWSSCVCASISFREVRRTLVQYSIISHKDIDALRYLA